MSGLVDTAEMYLRTIVDLEEEGIVPLRARISERIGHSGPTVSQTVGRMQRDGLVVLSPDRRLVLTQKGREIGLRVMRRHRLIEKFLLDVVGLPWNLLHEEACRLEHVISNSFEQRLCELLNHPVLSPYGTPIPAVDDLGYSLAENFLSGLKSLSKLVKPGEETTLRLCRLGESVQFSSSRLEAMAVHGLIPGSIGRFGVSEDYFVVATIDDRPLDFSPRAEGFLRLEPETCDHIYVSGLA